MNDIRKCLDTVELTFRFISFYSEKKKCALGEGDKF